LLAPFGGYAFNLAAISAAICMGDEAGAERDKRYLATVCAGCFYLLSGLFSSLVVAVFSQLPGKITLMLAGFALLGTMGASLTTAFNVPKFRDAALITFIITASGATLFGLGSTLWGLLGGAIALWMTGTSCEGD
jgi:benzoate membrane transport protein